MVTWVPGHSVCTASASTWAQSWRISSSARGSSRLISSILASASMGSSRSETTPSSAIATVRLASDGEMPLASSRPVMLLAYSRRAPSGKVRVIFSGGVTGLKLLRLYWKPDSDLGCSDLDWSLDGSLGWSVMACLLRLTPANERRKAGTSDISGDSACAIRHFQETGAPKRRRCTNYSGQRPLTGRKAALHAFAWKMHAPAVSRQPP